MVSTKSGSLRAFTSVELIVVLILVAVLAGLLLPALAAGREMSRRTACMNNLSQLSMALESYTSDYAGYFPSWAGYGAPLMNGHGRAATLVSARGQGGKLVLPLYQQNNRAQGIIQNRWFGHGTPVIPNSVPRKGDLNLAPVGLGCLLWGSYMGDARAFYCPSTDGGISDVPSAMSQYDPEKKTNHAAVRIDALKRAGGYDAKPVFFGDWGWSDDALSNNTGASYYGNGPWGPDGTPVTNARTIACDYVYRNLPVLTYSGGRSAPEHLTTPVKLLYTRPQIMVYPGCPPFKTARQLGSRAIIADSFAKGPAPKGTRLAGNGALAHRDGYNVLYGDWSAKWYGDPEQKLIWWDDGYDDLERDVGSDAPSLRTTTLCATAAGEATFDYENVRPGDAGYTARSSHAVWHMFDTTSGIDVNMP